MDSRYLDHYSYLDSPIHRIHAAPKLAVAALLALLCMFMPLTFVSFHVLLILFLAGMAFIGRLPFLLLIRRLRWFWLAILLLSLLRLIYPGGLYAVLNTFAWLGETLLIVTLLLATTRFADVLEVFAGMGVPRFLVTSAIMMYRFLFVVADDSQRMRRARLARTFIEPTSNRRWALRLHPGIIAQLFARSRERARRIQSAMTARG